MFGTQPKNQHSGEYNQVSHNANVVFPTDSKKPTHRKSPIDRTSKMIPSTAEAHCDAHAGTQVKMTFARVRTTNAGCALPRAMFTSVMRSLMATVVVPLQSPTQALIYPAAV